MPSDRVETKQEPDDEFEWQRPREGSGLLGRMSAFDKQLLLMVVVGLLFYAFTRSVDRQFDEATAAENAKEVQAHRNPWSKD